LGRAVFKEALTKAFAAIF